jgi:ribose transport system substrate-binding protein
MKPQAPVAIVVLACLVCLAIGCTRPVSIKNTVSKTTANPTIEIACITKMQTGEHWGAVKSGARLAASEARVTVEFYAPMSEADFQKQYQLFQEAIQKKVDAILIAASDEAMLAPLVAQAKAQGIVVVSIDSGFSNAEVDFHISSDNFKLGEASALAVLKLQDSPIKATIIGSLSESLNMQERIAGIVSVLDNDPEASISMDFSSAEESIAKEIINRLLGPDTGINVIFALEENSAHGVAATLVSKKSEEAPVFIAFGSSKQQISLLEKDIIDLLVVENPFNMGYLGIMKAVELIKGGKTSTASLRTDYALITKETLRTPENQRLAFPVY